IEPILHALALTVALVLGGCSSADGLPAGDESASSEGAEEEHLGSQAQAACTTCSGCCECLGTSCQPLAENCNPTECQTATCTGCGCNYSNKTAGTTCSTGRCAGSTCCSGCRSGNTCNGGTSVTACGKSGNVCVSCDDGNPC